PNKPGGARTLALPWPEPGRLACASGGIPDRRSGGSSPVPGMSFADRWKLARLYLPRALAAGSHLYFLRSEASLRRGLAHRNDPRKPEAAALGDGKAAAGRRAGTGPTNPA